MAGARNLLILILLLMLHAHCPQGAKILTICLVGGSHYLLMDDVSRILQDNGHEVRMFRQIGDGTLPGYKMPSTPYPVSTYSLDEKTLKEFDKFFTEYQKEFFMGKAGFQFFINLMNVFANQCRISMNQTDILDFLKKEQYDIAIIDAFNPCTFFISEKLGIPYISIFSGNIGNAIAVGLPSPPSYVPTFASQLTDRMNFMERLKNTLMYIGSYIAENSVQAIFNDIAERHFPADSRPSLSDLYHKAELWIYNVDFSIEFARPLLPHILCIGGLRAKPANPVSQDLEDYIAESAESGFIMVTLGSMLSSIPRMDLVKEINSAFAKIPQKVIWRYKASDWPEGLEVAPNVRLLDWVAQNDLLGHPKIRLLVTHGGMNSMMEAVYHGVPVLGIPLFGDQFNNLIRVKAKRMGEYIPATEIMAENFADAIRNIVGNKSYKTSVMKQSVILRSHPFPPDKQLLGWVEHIIQSGGGGHLRPYSYQQPWYQQFLLDVILFLSACVAAIIYLILRVMRGLIHFIFSNRKQKQN
ncbi:UDP-glucuronosyltransferase 3A1-like isoform X1 [Dendropsophus ebraccatus]|uniref:UDP-glucuronosyltransferase 3A1-like isoform X1 n=1 Tax=Dendropsophus ebraccatus TaxID=150705 RepID=UPI0038317AFD